MKPGMSRGLGMSRQLAADAHAEQAASRQREDVIERQRRDDGHLLHRLALLERRLQPGLVLQHVGDDVAVEQRGALGNTRGAAGVLQEGDVVRLDVGLLQGHAPAGGDGVVELDGARQSERRHHLLHLAHDQIDDWALGEAQQVAHAGEHDVLDRRLAEHVLQRLGEILYDDDGLGAGVLELVLELARRVERIDIHHREAGAQDAGDAHRVLQHVRHHNGHAVAARQALALQVGAHRLGHLVELAVGQLLVHADVRAAILVFGEAFLKQRHQRGVLRRVDLGRYAGWVVLEPNLVHVRLLTERLFCRHIRASGPACEPYLCSLSTTLVIPTRVRTEAPPAHSDERSGSGYSQPRRAASHPGMPRIVGRRR